MILLMLLLAALAMVKFWRQLLLLVLFLSVAVFCLGLIYIAEALHL
jgi:hypothetical protein